MMYRQISRVEAERLVREHDVVVADVRDKDSYEKDHIANAIHLSIAELREYSSKVDKEKAILVYCYHGVSSQLVAQNLVELGCKEVYSLVGGFEIWKAHHPLASDKNK